LGTDKQTLLQLYIGLGGKIANSGKIICAACPIRVHLDLGLFILGISLHLLACPIVSWNNLAMAEKERRKEKKDEKNLHSPVKRPLTIGRDNPNG
jgi:hypothetical protein